MFIAFGNMLREMPPQVLEGNAELLCCRLDRRAGGEDVVQPSTIRVLAHTALKWSAAPATRAGTSAAGGSLTAVGWRGSCTAISARHLHHLKPRESRAALQRSAEKP